jgi:hypothetical protein
MEETRNALFLVFGILVFEFASPVMGKTQNLKKCFLDFDSTIINSNK